jgi:hypothetical protein
VEVELAAALVLDHVGGRQLVRLDVVELREDLAEPLDRLGRNREVEVVVRTGLVAEQRIDTPTAVDPPFDPGRVEAVEELQDVARGHGAKIRTAASW